VGVCYIRASFPEKDKGTQKTGIPWNFRENIKHNRGTKTNETKQLNF
jgi:hypothetical protein